MTVADLHASSDASFVPSVRRWAVATLNDTANGAARLAEPGDSEALHDFRVGLRRLRSVLRVYGAPLGIAPGWARRWKKLADQTGPGRDTEVQIDWVLAQGLGTEVKPVVSYLEKRLERAYRVVRGDVVETFFRLHERFRPLIASPLPAHAGTVVDPSAQQVERSFATLKGRVASVRSAKDRRRIHDARIAAKRLRYILEPLQDEIPEAKNVAASLKRIQTDLGLLHDLHVIENTLQVLRRHRKFKSRGRQSTLKELRRRAVAQQRERYKSFDAHWHQSVGPGLAENLVQLGVRLAAPTGADTTSPHGSVERAQSEPA